jgi:hypothetical protein
VKNPTTRRSLVQAVEAHADRGVFEMVAAETLRCGGCARESDGDLDNQRVTCRGTAMVERVFPGARLVKVTQ